MSSLHFPMGKLDSDQFINYLNKSPNPVLVDFSASWCMPCRMMEPTMKKVEQQFKSQVDVLRVDADENSELLKKLKVYGIPTLIVYREGEEMMRATGAQSQRQLIKLFETAISGIVPEKKGLNSTDRVLRLGAGLLLLGLAWVTGYLWILYLIAGGLMFSAFYDRCPIWNALVPKIRKLFRV